ncbi:MAG: hypothetical protein CM15mP109_05770 [Candidatus Dadabacteria bacterium]|nr:MAG: hypothetical protein CM15mP109_05770 [Candidatus Dadabacteria bacterium]
MGWWEIFIVGSVGLVISIVIGSENFNDFLKVQIEWIFILKAFPFERNIPVVLALISIWYNNFF